MNKDIVKIFNFASVVLLAAVFVYGGFLMVKHGSYYFWEMVQHGVLK